MCVDSIRVLGEIIMIGWAGGRAWFIVYGVVLTPATVTPGLGHRDNGAKEIRPTCEAPSHSSIIPMFTDDNSVKIIIFFISLYYFNQ